MGKKKRRGLRVVLVAPLAWIMACSGAGTVNLTDQGNGAGEPDATSAGDSGIDGGSEVLDGGQEASASDASVVDVAADVADSSASVIDASPMVADPCPDPSRGKLAVNCSPTCDAGASDCRSVSCDSYKTNILGPSIARLAAPFVIRTPDHSGKDSECILACTLTHANDTPHRAFGIGFTAVVPENSWVRIRVDAPWLIQPYAGDDPSPFCPTTSPPEDKIDRGCVTFKTQGGILSPYILVYADDPDAVARNIYVDSPSDGSGCP